jgi:hypothetical protein
MNTMQEATKKKFNTIFSNTLLKQYDYYCLKNLGGIGSATSNGHGPFVELTSGSVVYDLRSYNDRWIFGNSHPLEMKTKVSQELDKLSSLSTQEVTLLCSNRIQIFHKWDYSNYFLSTDLFIPKDYKLINTSNVDDIRAACTQKHIQATPLIHLTYQGCLLYWDEIQKLFKTLDQNLIGFGVIEENTLGFSHNDFVYSEFTQSHPVFLSSNFNLGLFICFSNSIQNSHFEDISSYKLEIFNSFTRFLYEGKFFGSEGRIHSISSLISKEIESCQSIKVKQKCLQLTVEYPKISLEELLKKGIMTTNFKSQLHLSFPISIKTEHLNEICQILAIVSNESN